MAKLLTKGGEEICPLTSFQTAGPIGPMGTSFTGHVTFDESMTIGHRDSETFLIEHDGTRYNAMVQKTSSVARDGRATGTISGKVWPL